MEKQLVRKTFTIGETSYDCWVIKIGNKFWFNAHDIAVFLDYQDPKQAVRNIPTEAQKLGQTKGVYRIHPLGSTKLATSHSSCI